MRVSDDKKVRELCYKEDEKEIGSEIMEDEAIDDKIREEPDSESKLEEPSFASTDLELPEEIFEEIKNDNRNLDDRIKTLERINYEEKTRADELENDKHELQLKIKEIEKKTASDNCSTKLLEQSRIKQLSNDLTCKDDELSESKKTIHHLEQECQSLLTQIESLNEVAVKLRKETEQKSIEIKNRESRIANLTSEKEDELKQIEDFTNKSKSSSIEVQNLNSQISDLRTQLFDKKTEFDQLDEAKCNEIRNLKDQLEEKNGEVKILMEADKEHKKVNDTLLDTIRQKEKIIESQQNDLADVHNPKALLGVDHEVSPTHRNLSRTATEHHSTSSNIGLEIQNKNKTNGFAFEGDLNVALFKDHLAKIFFILKPFSKDRTHEEVISCVVKSVEVLKQLIFQPTRLKECLDFERLNSDLMEPAGLAGKSPNFMSKHCGGIITPGKSRVNKSSVRSLTSEDAGDFLNPRSNRDDSSMESEKRAPDLRSLESELKHASNLKNNLLKPEEFKEKQKEIDRWLEKEFGSSTLDLVREKLASIRQSLDVQTNMANAARRSQTQFEEEFKVREMKIDNLTAELTVLQDANNDLKNEIEQKKREASCKANEESIEVWISKLIVVEKPMTKIDMGRGLREYFKQRDNEISELRLQNRKLKLKRNNKSTAENSEGEFEDVYDEVKPNLEETISKESSQKAISKLQGQIETMREQFEKLQADLKTARESPKILQAELESVQEQSEKLQAELETEQKRWKKLETEYEERKSAAELILQKLNREKESELQERLNKTRLAEELKTELDQQNKKCGTLQNEISKNSESHKKKAAELETNVAEYKQQIDTISKALEKTKEESRLLNTKFELLQKTLAENEKELEVKKRKAELTKSSTITWKNPRIANFPGPVAIPLNVVLESLKDEFIHLARTKLKIEQKYFVYRSEVEIERKKKRLDQGYSLYSQALSPTKLIRELQLSRLSKSTCHKVLKPKKALIISITYRNHSIKNTFCLKGEAVINSLVHSNHFFLPGSENDLIHWSDLLPDYGWQSQSVRILSESRYFPDDDEIDIPSIIPSTRGMKKQHPLPTLENIYKHLDWLTSDIEPGERILLIITGAGTYIPADQTRSDIMRQENLSLNEPCLLPLDFIRSRILNNDNHIDINGNSIQDSGICSSNLRNPGTQQELQPCEDIEIAAIPCEAILTYLKRVPSGSAATVIFDFGIDKSSHNLPWPSNPSQTTLIGLSDSQLKRAFPDFLQSSRDELYPRYFNVQNLLSRIKRLNQKIRTAYNIKNPLSANPAMPIDAFECEIYLLTACMKDSLAYETEIEGEIRGVFSWALQRLLKEGVFKVEPVLYRHLIPEIMKTIKTPSQRSIDQTAEIYVRPESLLLNGSVQF